MANPNLDKLLIFTEKGFEVPMTKIYTIEWELIPHPIVEHLFVSDIKGHIQYDINQYGNPENAQIKVDQHGKVIFDAPVKLYFNDPNNTVVTKGGTYEKVKEILLLDEIPEVEEYDKVRYRHVVNGVVQEYTAKEKERICNTVRLTFNTLDQSYIMDYPVTVVFGDFRIINKTENVITNTTENPNDFDSEESYNEWKQNNTQGVYAYVGSYDQDDQGITLAPPPPSADTTYNDILDALIRTNFTDEMKKSLYPGIRYQGCIWQDKVSTEFVAANTIIILEDKSEDNWPSPQFEPGSGLKFMFKFQKDSEMRFISSNTVADIIWDDICVIDTNPEPEQPFSNMSKPVHFAVGFQAELEGCYQNIMAMYIRHEYKDEDTDEIITSDYLLGLITFFTEVEGEDERYRALLGNMGIPDPEKYSNIFKEQDPEEEGVDWILVNNKSKELMINYDNIFPYVGTYKALLGAVRFLGYYDLIFKEWYKIKDKTGRDKFITLQAYDLQKGESLQTKLKRINVDFGEFEKYKKLNRLTMIYHLNEIEEIDGEYVPYKLEDVSAYRAKKSVQDDEGNNKQIFTWVNVPNQSMSSYKGQYFQLPNTVPVYLYRTDEILAKLYSVKEWLEKYILGVNCYISDICGEGIIIERLKTQAYATEHYIQDFTSEGKFTPKIIDASRGFINSSTMLTCTLNEFNNLTLEDYDDWNIEKFIKDISVINGHNVYVSPPFETLVAADEYQFRLQLDEPESGTLAEFTDKTSITNPILVRDNKILFYDNISQESKLQPDELPLIEIKKANIRYCHGNWRNNVCYTINTVIDQFTGKEFYVFKGRENEVDDYRGLQKVHLAPIPVTTRPENIFGAAQSLDDDTDGNYFGLTSELIYTSKNKWNIPMFIMRNYLIRNTNQVLKGDYILEILEGRMIFRNKSPEVNVGKAIGAEIRFGYYYDIEQGEQEIDTYYTYLSERVPIYYFDIKGFKNDTNDDKWDNADIMASYMTVNKTVDVNVNRLGNYTVQVNAYDSYNNIFVNNSDDITTVLSNPIPVDIILNQEFMKNDKDFYENSSYGQLMSTEEKTQLFNDIYKKSGYPMYPQNWRIYDIDPVLDTENQIKYDSISYAQEIPQTGNFIIFNNFTERILGITGSGTSFKISLCDENPNPQTIINSSYIGLCVYDELSKEILWDLYPLTVTDCSIVQPNIENIEYMDYTYNKSYVNIKTDSIDLETLTTLTALVNDHTIESNRNINGYVYSANELILDVSDISVNYKESYTLVTDYSQHFVENQVIKICFSSEEEIHNNYTNNTIDNEYVLRVVDVSLLEDSSVVYKLDGLIDLYKLNNKIYHNKAEHYAIYNNISPLITKNPYIIKMCPAHLRAAQYTLRVSDIGQESVVMHNGAETNEITVGYEYLPLLFNHYLDTTYSAAIYPYDPYMLNNIYTDVSVIFNETDNLYIYRNFPVTIKKDRIAILRPDPNQEILTTEFFDKNGNTVDTSLRIDWDWQSYIIDDLENSPNLYLDLVNKQTIFKSCNPILPIRHELLGTQSPNMTVTDIYGNALTNNADGFMFVDLNEDSVYNRAEMNTRNIYYRDVYIIGFSASINAMHTMSANGETASFTNNQTGADTKSEVYPLDINYVIYYNDGTILYNEGASINLLSKTGKKARGNKVKVTLPEAVEPHKSVQAQIQAQITFDKTNERDLIQSDIIEDIDIYQYGYSKTVQIYDLKFSVNDLPSDGIEQLEEYIIRDYITNISYTNVRSEGEIETINASNLNDANLVIKQFTLIDKKKGLLTSVEPNYNGRKLLGILMLTVEFYVNGVTETIRTNGIANVYQQ